LNQAAGFSNLELPFSDRRLFLGCFGDRARSALQNAETRKKTLTKTSTPSPSALPPLNRRSLSVLWEFIFCATIRPIVLVKPYTWWTRR